MIGPNASNRICQYTSVPYLPVRVESKQADAGSRFLRHFLCGALLCNCSSAERQGLPTHVPREYSAEPFMRSILSLRIFTSLPGSRQRFLSRCKSKTPTINSTLLYSSIVRLYAQNPVFETVHEKSVKVYISTQHVQRDCSVEPSMRRILCD